LGIFFCDFRYTNFKKKNQFLNAIWLFFLIYLWKKSVSVIFIYSCTANSKFFGRHGIMIISVSSKKGNTFPPGINYIRKDFHDFFFSDCTQTWTLPFYVYFGSYFDAFLLFMKNPECHFFYFFERNAGMAFLTSLKPVKTR
jgi:hypothetical protein